MGKCQKAKSHFEIWYSKLEMTTFLKHTVSSDHDHGTAARTRKKISKSKKKFMICKDQRRCQIVSHKLNQSCPTIETRTNNLPVRWVHFLHLVIPRKERWRGTRTFTFWQCSLASWHIWCSMQKELYIFIFIFLRLQCYYHLSADDLWRRVSSELCTNTAAWILFLYNF